MTAAVFSAAYSNSYHSFWERIQPRSKSTNFNLFWVKYHSFSVKSYDNLVSVSLVIVLQKGCVPIAQWRNAAPNFFNIFLPLFLGATIFAAPRAFYTLFFPPTVHYCIKTLRLWFLFLGPTIIFVPRAFLPVFCLPTVRYEFFAFSSYFLLGWRFCHCFQHFTPIFFRQPTDDRPAEPFWELKSKFHIIEKWYLKVAYIATIEQNCAFYRILTELGVLSHVQFFDISNYTWPKP